MGSSGLGVGRDYSSFRVELGSWVPTPGDLMLHRLGAAIMSKTEGPCQIPGVAIGCRRKLTVLPGVLQHTHWVAAVLTLIPGCSRPWRSTVPLKLTRLGVPA